MARAVSNGAVKRIGGPVSQAPAFARTNERVMVEPDAAVAATATDVGSAQAATCAWRTIRSGRLASGRDVEPVAEALGYGGTPTTVSARAGSFKRWIEAGGSEQ